MHPIASKTRYPNMKRRYQYCDTCGTLLPAPGYYCVQCGPPVPPEADPEKGLNASQASLRIALLTLIFIVIAVFKLEIDLTSLFQEAVIVEAPLKVAEDEDFELFFKVKVSFANLRDKPNTKTGKIIFVLTQGTAVEVLEKKGKWSKIRSKPGPGEQARIGWMGSKLLDSEIK
jgi:hypothetical protein